MTETARPATLAPSPQTGTARIAGATDGSRTGDSRSTRLAQMAGVARITAEVVRDRWVSELTVEPAATRGSVHVATRR